MQTMLENLRSQGEDARMKIISELGIFELRGLAREVGVPSPTTRKRDQLISMILEKLASNVAVPTKKTNKGRPVKKLSNLDQIMSAMTGGEDNFAYQAVRHIKPYDQVISFAQETPVFSFVEKAEKRNFEGVFRLTNKVGYFLDLQSRTKVFMPADFTKKYLLQTGDFLSVEASKMNSANQFIVDKILAINFKEPSKYTPPESDKKLVISFDKIPFGDIQIFKGRRNVVEYKHNVYEDERFSRFAEQLEKQGCKLVVLGLNTSFEDAILFSSLPGVINLTTRYAESAQIGLDKVVDAISLVERLAQNGHKVVLFVCDIIELLATLDLCFEEKDRIMDHLAEAVVVVQKLISCARAYEDESGATLLMTYRDLNKQDQFLINEIFKVSNVFKAE